MSLLSFFRRKDPTRDWPPARPVPLRFDIERWELNGIGRGAPVDALRVLGRPANPPSDREYHWLYPSLGLEVLLDGSSRVKFFTAVFQADAPETELVGYPDFQPCRLYLRFGDGTDLEVTAATRRAEIESRLGPLTREGNDVDGMDVVSAGSAMFVFSFDAEGRWTLLDIEPPLE